MSTPPRSPRRPVRLLTLVVAVLALIAVLGLAARPATLSALADAAGLTGPEPAPAPEPEPEPVPAAAPPAPSDGGRYFGVSVTQGQGIDDRLAAFSSAVGVAPTLQSFFQSFKDDVNVARTQAAMDAGRLPMITWEPYYFTDQKANPFPLQDIAAGRFDDYLRRQGQQFAAFQRPLVIRLAHEMNGDWYPWGQGVNGNTPADYVAAFRHVHEVVASTGATNVVWLWAPNFLNGISATTPLASLYPGDDVVDWVGADGYYGEPQDTFPTKFATTMAQLDVVAPGKPVVLAEVSVARTPDRAGQIEELVSALAADPRVVGFVWSEFADPNVADWRVANDPAAAAALGLAVRAGGFDQAPQQTP